jgi:hypothetical protein
MRVFLLTLAMVTAASAQTGATAPGRYAWTPGGFACIYWSDHERIVDMVNSGDHAAAIRALTQMESERRCEIFDARADVFVDRKIGDRVCIRRPGDIRCGWALNVGFSR